jgi:putative transcriptional regulator
MHTVVETPVYRADAERLFSPDERTAIVDRLAADPVCGVVVPESGGIRKVRFGFGGRGKSGGARILSLRWKVFAGLFAGGFCQERESRSFGIRTQCIKQDSHGYDRELPETKMTKSAFDKIKAGLGEANEYLDGSADKRNFRTHVPARVDVKKIRTRLGLSQESFAQTYGFALSAVRDWEQGRRQPERSARILLKVVEKEPDAVTRALAK